MSDNPFVGTWTYRSLVNDLRLATAFDDLEFGRATLVIEEAPLAALKGTIGGSGWSLALKGSRAYGNPMSVRFQGTGIVNGAKWAYDYQGYLVPDWPDGVDQVAAIVGSVIRTIDHPGGNPGSVNPAGVVCTFFAVRSG